MHSDNPAGSLEPAEWITRLFAYVIDVLAWSVGWSIFGFGVAFGLGVSRGFFVMALVGVWVLVWIAWMYRDGRSVGKRMLNLQVVYAETGVPLRWGANFIVREVVVRTIVLGVVGSITFYIGTVVNYLWPLWDDRQQALHDKMLSTRVVKIARPDAASPSSGFIS